MAGQPGGGKASAPHHSPDWLRRSPARGGGGRAAADRGNDPGAAPRVSGRAAWRVPPCADAALFGHQPGRERSDWRFAHTRGPRPTPNHTPKTTRQITYPSPNMLTLFYYTLIVCTRVTPPPDQIFTVRACTSRPSKPKRHASDGGAAMPYNYMQRGKLCRP